MQNIYILQISYNTCRTLSIHILRRLYAKYSTTMGLGFYCDDPVTYSKVLVILISIGMGSWWEVSYLLIIAHGWLGGMRASIQSIYLSFTLIALLFSNILLIEWYPSLCSIDSVVIPLLLGVT